MSGRPAWEPRREDYEQAFIDQNPWHLTGEVPVDLAFEKERPLAGLLWRRLLAGKPRRYQLILGPRRVGKTTVLYQTIRHLLADGIPASRLWYLRLDHPLLMGASLDQIVRWIRERTGATARAPVFLFLDELAYSRAWDLWLKTFHDENWPIRLAASSSSTAILRDRMMESGVGRWEEQHLAPYLFTEYLELTGGRVEVPLRSSLEETLRAAAEANWPNPGLAERRRRYLLTGGFPELLMGSTADTGDENAVFMNSQRLLRSDAVERAVYKDIPQAFGIENPLLLERLLYLLAGQVAGILSPAKIGERLYGLSQPTFDKYLSYLAQSFLVFTLPNYSKNEAAKQKRGRKLYFVDVAVRNAALQRGLAPLRDPMEMGLLQENLVASHLRAICVEGEGALFHWREGSLEVDLVYDHPEFPMAFEISSSPRHSVKGLLAFAEEFPRFRGRCWLVSPESTFVAPANAVGRSVGSVPLDLLLLASGAHAQSAKARRFDGRP